GHEEDDEGPRRGGDGVFGVVVSGGADEGDVPRDAEARGLGAHGAPGGRRLEVVDAQIEGRDTLDALLKTAEDGRAAGGVEERRDGAAVDDPGLRIADEVFAVGEV